MDGFTVQAGQPINPVSDLNWKPLVMSGGTPQTPSTCTDASRSATVRDAWCWPFTADSIWNKGVGNGAFFQPSSLAAAAKVRLDDVLLLQIAKTDPERDLYQPDGTSAQRCTPVGSRRNDQWAPDGFRLKFPDTYTTPQLRSDYKPNFPAVLLQADKNSVVEIQPLARCETAGPVFGYTAQKTEARPSQLLGTIRGTGDFGAHGGSGISALGGTIRTGEISGALPIRHALKILVQATRYLYFDPSPLARRGYRWPALRHDLHAATEYLGTNHELQMGSLLAIPSEIDLSSIGLKTAAAKKMAKAMQAYGAYIVDDAAEDAFYVVAERGVTAEIGISTDGVRSGDFYDDLNLLFRRLQVITNNTPSSVGGGGQSIALPPPAFRD